MDYGKILEKAMKEGQQRHPKASRYHQAAFANSVAYLVTGASGGYGGPSIREHAVSWALAGDGTNDTSQGLTVQYPDGRVPRAGEWNFQQACDFADPICFGVLPATAERIYKDEPCFDDDPEDITTLKKR